MTTATCDFDPASRARTAPQKGLFARFFDAMIAARMRQADARNRSPPAPAAAASAEERRLRGDRRDGCVTILSVIPTVAARFADHALSTSVTHSPSGMRRTSRKPVRPIGGQRGILLLAQQTRQHHVRARREQRRIGRASRLERRQQDIGEHQIEWSARARNPRAVDPLAAIHSHERADAVEARILARNRNGSASMSLASTVARERLGGRDGEHAGAGADVEHAPRAPRSWQSSPAPAGSRASCRDGRCRRRAPPRSRCRCGSARSSRDRARHAP